MSKWTDAVGRLRDNFKGALLQPGTDGYDSAQPIWNAMWNNQKPALIARCVGHSDVRAAVLFAREYGISTVVRGGGHSASGKSTCDGGLVIDLSTLKGVHIDTSSRTAVAGGG